MSTFVQTRGSNGSDGWIVCMGLTVVNALFSNSNVHFATIMTFTFIEHCHSDRCRCRHRPRYYHWGTAEFRIFVALKCLNSLILITSGKSHAPHSSGECECIGVSVQSVPFFMHRSSAATIFRLCNSKIYRSISIRGRETKRDAN